MGKEITTSFWLHMHCSTRELYLKRKSSLICVLNNDIPSCNICKRCLGNLKNFQLVEKQNCISLSDKLCERKLFVDVGWSDWSVSNGITSKIKSRKIANILTNRIHMGLLMKMWGIHSDLLLSQTLQQSKMWIRTPAGHTAKRQETKCLDANKILLTVEE